ncbi:MAG: NAD(P)/FAD-dependent oxidoreductase, partial [Aristaeellaceae bacterium]
MAEFPSWQQGIRQGYPPLRGTLRADAVIVGGGLTGVLTALMLQEQGVQTALLEARRLGQGATFGCGGLVTCQAFPAYRTIADTAGTEAAGACAQLLREAVRGVTSLAERTGMACGLTHVSVYAYAETRDDLPALESLLALEGKLGLAVSEAPDAGGCPFPVELSAALPHQALLAPLPFLLGLAREAAALGCRVFEESPVRDVSGRSVRTPGGTVVADRILLCTGVPLDCFRLPVLSLLEPRLREARVLQWCQPLHTAQLSV